MLSFIYFVVSHNEWPIWLSIWSGVVVDVDDDDGQTEYEWICLQSMNINIDKIAQKWIFDEDENGLCGRHAQVSQLWGNWKCILGEVELFLLRVIWCVCLMIAGFLLNIHWRFVELKCFWGIYLNHKQHEISVKKLLRACFWNWNFLLRIITLFSVENSTRLPLLYILLKNTKFKTKKTKRKNSNAKKCERISEKTKEWKRKTCKCEET